MEIFQTLLVIIIIIIAIALIIWIIADVVFPPTSFFAPFKSGTTIRIKSLSNNKYLRVANCQPNITPDYTQCSLKSSQNWAGCNSGIQQIVADCDNPNQPGIEWTLCEYVGNKDTPGDNAVYVLYYGSQSTGQVLKYNNQFSKYLYINESNKGCSFYNQNYSIIEGPYFAFILQENNNKSNNGLQSSVFQIIDGNPKPGLVPSLSNDNIMICPGKDLSLYNGCKTINTCKTANNCPSLVFMTDRKTVVNNTNLDPINYTFSIEIVK